MSNRFEWKQFDKLRSCEDIEDYIEGREYRHGEYCHYTTLENINKILKSGEIWISSVTNFNDKKEVSLFTDNGKLYFASCWSTGVNENLPLWYLYAGMDGKGGRLRFTKANMKKIIENSEYILKKRNSDNGIKLDITPIFKDIIYCSDSHDNQKIVDLKYNTMTNHKMPKSEFEKYKNKNIGLYKSIIWYYEKETRILIELNVYNLDLDDRTKAYIKENANEYVIAMKIPNDILKKVRVECAPEISDYEELEKHESIKRIHAFK